jgi:hypothetical protein
MTGALSGGLPRSARQSSRSWASGSSSRVGRSYGTPRLVARNRNSKPPRWAWSAVSTLSVDAFEDLSPTTLALTQTQLMRAVSLAVDAGLLFGDGTGEKPVGVGNVSGHQTPTGGLEFLAVFAPAIGKLLAVNARPGAVALNPLDYGTLLELTEGTRTAFTANVPLLRALGQALRDAVLPRPAVVADAGRAAGHGRDVQPSRGRGRHPPREGPGH